MPVNFPYLYTIAFTLQDGTTLRKFYCFIYRFSFNYDEAGDRFLDITKWPVGHYLPFLRCFHDPGIFKKDTIARYKFVLRGYATNPVHSLFHPYLDLFGRGYFVAVFVPEDQNEFVHDVFVFCLLVNVLNTCR